jgi:hypothetical protein
MIFPKNVAFGHTGNKPKRARLYLKLVYTIMCYWIFKKGWGLTIYKWPKVSNDPDRHSNPRWKIFCRFL